MYKIMLADDEGREMESLKSLIAKEFGDACTVQCAGTGRSVIELAEKFQPDLAVISVQLPGISGMDAMKEIRKNNEKIRFVVVSSYDKFDYAVEAVKLGALEYITKPLDHKKIIAALKKGMEQIDREREKRTQELMVKEKLETVIPIIENGFIYNILFYKQFHEDIDNYLTMLDLDISYAYMLAIVCGEEQQGSHMTNAVGSSVRMHQQYGTVRACVKEYCGGIVGSVMSNKLAVLVPCESETIAYSSRTHLISRTRELVRELRKKTGIAFRIGIGSPGKLKRMSESYNEAVSALGMTTGSVAHADDLPIGCRYENDYPIQLERRLFEEIEKGDTERAIRTGETFFAWLEEKSDGNLEEIRIKILEFVLYAERISYDRSGMTYQFHSRKGYLAALTGTDDIEELKQWFLNKIMENCQNVLGKRKEKSNHIIEKAQVFILENYKRDISLEDVSRNVNVSPYYFSKIFKEATGEGFVKYLTAIRIEKAKELLSSTEYSMREICSMCGYSDPNYFSRSFKKNAGITPSDYKAMHE
jgi:two-component system response regulator YesN